MCDAEQPGGGQRSEISPVEAVRRGVEEEEFVGANDPAAEPERQWPAEAIARHGARGGKAVDRHENACTANAGSWKGRNALQNRHATGEILALGKPGAERPRRPDRDQTPSSPPPTRVGPKPPQRRTPPCPSTT